MKVRLAFEVEVDAVGLTQYMAAYPGFEGETPADVLIREAITIWDYEGLLAREPETVGEEVTA